MRRLLIVEDSNMVLRVLQHLAHSELKNAEIVTARTFQEAKMAVVRNPDFFIAIVDLNLPDAPNGEIASFTLQQDIPTIVLTGNFDEQKRKTLVDSGVVDYVVKESRHAYQYAVKLVKRLSTNHKTKVMVVDDSTLSRKYIRQLLERHLYQVVDAEDGVDALEKLKLNPDTRLVLTDYEMPRMDGFKLVNEIRRVTDKRSMAIIGLSSVESGVLSARFIKGGANDFLNKPFYPEEFYCRVIQNLEAIELIEEIEDTANRDYLTGLYNRRAFFERATALLNTAKQERQSLSFALIDLDKFKSINDYYGHACGDKVLKHFARLLQQHCSNLLCARVGGEEFAIVMPNLSNEQAVELVDDIRQKLVAERIGWEGKELCISFSAGVVTDGQESLDLLYQHADEMLYRAKEAGRNMVFGQEEE